MIPGTFGFQRVSSPIQFVGVTSKFTNTGNLSVDYSSFTNGNTPLPNDFLLFVGQSDQGDSLTSEDWEFINFTDNDQSCINTSWKLHVAGDTSLNVTSVGDHATCAVLCFRYVNLIAPIDASREAVNTGDGTSVSIPHNNSTVPNTYVISIVGHDIASNSSQVSFNNNTSLTSFTELVDYSATTGWDGGFGIAGGYKASAGSINNTTGSIGEAKHRSYQSIVLAPE